MARSRHAAPERLSEEGMLTGRGGLLRACSVAVRIVDGMGLDGRKFVART